MMKVGGVARAAYGRNLFYFTNTRRFGHDNGSDNIFDDFVGNVSRPVLTRAGTRCHEQGLSNQPCDA